MRPPRGGGGFRGRSGDRGGRFGGGGRGRGGGGRFGGGGGFRDEGPPAEVVEVSTFVHACEGDAVTKLTNEKVPYFNAPIYLQNKTQIGKVDEIFGPINESFFSVKMFEGVIATSYNQGDKFFIDPMKLLPLSRFLPQPKYALQNQLHTTGAVHLTLNLQCYRARLQDLLEVVAVVEEVVLVVAVVDSVEEVPQGAVVDLPGVEGVDSEDVADIRI
ncbi:hypothetical protein QYE76_066455 [Lolium multiflorum]|uniref:H/ACA ribonucleoprotein complex subunit n=1 Tax=Lolium multiflorum TaxID=4521 RepID=A0AAD8V5Q6_LOLMU|nr:hypothetical protein QYE76_048355 [Lolium multiflorum]KAK1648650.1 hypothetical protein QYE76_066455 [Lolium multiflorum]